MDADNLAKLKHCTQCNQEIPSSEFYKSPNTYDGLYSKCKSCFNKIAKQRRQRIKEEIKAERAKRGNFVSGTIVPTLYPKIMDQPDTIRKVVTAWMENPNATKYEIATMTNMTVANISWACYHNPYLKAFRSLAQKSVKNLIPLAVHGLKQCLSSSDLNLVSKVAIELLKSEKILGSERIDVTVDDVRSKPIEEVRRLVQEAKLIPQPTISSDQLIGTPND